jgi:tetratricopeptide (TPR) repeat protein
MELENKAQNLESTGDYLSAIEYYLLTLEAFKLESTTENLQFRKGKILHRVADLYTEVGDLTRAIKYYEDAKKHYLTGKQTLIEIYRSLGEISLNLGACFLAKSKYQIALRHFKKAFEFTERFVKNDTSSLRLKALKQNIFTLVVSSLCLFSQNGDLNHINQHLKKAAQLSEEFKVSGIATDLSHFLSFLINEQISEAYVLLKEKILGTIFTSPLSTVLENVVIGVTIDLAVKFIPTLKNTILDKRVEGEGEVLFSQKVFEEMLLYGIVFANRKMLPPQYKEVLALILGKIEKGNVVISELVPITSGTETDVQFKDEHYAKVSEINAMAAERNEFIVGWYHTHPGLGLFLSPVDIINQLGYQSINEKAIAIEFDFIQMTPSRSGFAIFRLNEASLAASYHSVSWRVLNTPKLEYLQTVSLPNRFQGKLFQILLKNPQISIADLAKQMDHSEALLEQVIPKLIENQQLPNREYDPDSKIISKKKD